MCTKLLKLTRAYAAIILVACHGVTAPSHAMTWAIPGTSNAPISTGLIAPITPGRVFAVGNSGDTRLLDTSSTGTLTWSVRMPMMIARSAFGLTTLPSGRVLATGGGVAGVATASTERYDPTVDAWSADVPMLAARQNHLAIPLSNGTVLVAGGSNASGSATRSVELFDETTGLWLNRAQTPWNLSARDRGFSISDGKVIIVHSLGVGIYDPSTNSWADGAPPPTAANLPVLKFAAAQLNDGRVAIATMGIYDATTNVWTAIPQAPRAFTAAAGITGNRAIFAGGELIPCAPSLFCQSNFAYEYSAASNQWSDLGSDIGTSGSYVTLNNVGGYFELVNQSPSNGYSLSGVLYQRSSLSELYINSPLDLPLSPTAGQSYSVNVGYAAGSEILSRPPTGIFTVSDGTASCQITIPAAACTITTISAGPKTVSVNYAGDDNFAPRAFSYRPQPYVIVDRSASVYVQSMPSGIYDIGFLYSTAYPFPSGTLVTLNASATVMNTFTGWLGDCVGMTPCTFTMPADRHARVKAFVAPTANAPFSIDVDRDGAAIAATDGLVILRYLLAFPNSDVNVGAINPAGLPPGGSTVNYLSGIRPRLDVDGNGQADALTDGLLILRYLAGFRGEALIANCVGANARRSTAAAIESYLATLLP